MGQASYPVAWAALLPGRTSWLPGLRLRSAGRVRRAARGLPAGEQLALPVSAWSAPFAARVARAGDARGYVALPARGRPVLIASRDAGVLGYLAGSVLSAPPGAGQVLSLAATAGLRLLRFPAAWTAAAAVRGCGIVIVGGAAGGTAASAAALPGGSLADLVREAGGRAACLALSKDPNGKVTLLLFPPEGDQPDRVAKVPPTSDAARSVRAEARRLAEVDRAALGPLAATVPQVIAEAEHDGRPVLVMTALPGRAMLAGYHAWRHTARQDLVRADFDAAQRWLADLQERTAAGRGDLAGMVDDIGEAIAGRFGEDEQIAGDLAALAALARRLRGHEVPLAAVHGDFWPGNLLIDGGQVRGVIDWESASASGLPTHDLARFALSYSLYLDRHTRPGRRVPGHPGLRAGQWGAGLAYAIDGAGWYPDLVRGFVGAGLARLGVPAELARDVLLAGIARVCAEADHPDFARGHLLAFRRLGRQERS